MWNETLVGAGLLAKAGCQSIEIVTDRTPSRASPLPHWFCAALLFQYQHPINPGLGFDPVGVMGEPREGPVESLLPIGIWTDVDPDVE
ncbi:hypothetical protein D3C73_1483570 [compost metagenome]